MAKRVVNAPKPVLCGPLTLDQLAATIRHRRSAAGLTIAEAAGLCGLSKQAYHNLELGAANSRSDTLFSVCAALGIEMAIAEAPIGQAAMDD